MGGFRDREEVGIYVGGGLLKVFGSDVDCTSGAGAVLQGEGVSIFELSTDSILRMRFSRASM